MSVYEFSRPVPLGAVFTLRIVTLFERIYDGFCAWRSQRQTETALMKLSDWELADIGLTRGEISQIAEDLARR